MMKEQSMTLKIKKKSKLVSEENHYEKIKLIGQGTFGKVFLAKNKKDKKLYAIKEVLQDPRYKNRELGIISRINHQNVIYMIDYYIKIVNEEYYLNIVMDYFPTSLSAMIKEQRKVKKPFAPEVRKVLTFQMFKALYYMQLNKICHRDLKPPNVLINDQTMQLKICDFGSAKILQKKQKNVAYICSRYYRAPQLILGSTSYTTQIDVWSAGCIIIEFLTLQPIFPGDSSLEQLIQIIKILGTPPEKSIKMYQQANLTTLNMPKIKANNWSKILKKYNPQPELVDLISKIVSYDVDKRLKPYQILTHPYFADIKSFKTYTSQLENLFQFSSLNNKKNKKQVQHLSKLFSTQVIKQESLEKEEQTTYVLKQKGSNSQLDMELVKQETLPTATPQIMSKQKVLMGFKELKKQKQLQQQKKLQQSS